MRAIRRYSALPQTRKPRSISVTREGTFALGGLALLAVWLFGGVPLFYLSHDRPEEFMGFTAHGWTAIGTLALALVTLALALGTAALVIVGLYQLRSIREEGRISRTIAISDRYDIDPVLDLRLRRIARARLNGALDARPMDYRADLRTILNYLDSLAVGIQQDLYIEKLAMEHNGAILVGTVKQYLDGAAAAKYGLNVQNYETLMVLYRKWKNELGS
jgi:hypothetical protein